MPGPSADQSGYGVPASRGDVRAAELTGAGRGGIATIGICGREWPRAIERCFAPASGQVTLQPGRIYYGRWHGGRVAAAGESVVVTPLGEQAAEVHCHGGRAAVAAILDDLAAAGAAICDWTTWLDQQTDTPLLIAEAGEVLAQTVTARTAAIALDQVRGALHDQVLQWIASLEQGAPWPEVRSAVRTVWQRSDVGQHLATPWNVVLAGAPNVGKSSLLNALLGYQRAITFDAPGTTRDVLAAETVIDGWPLRISDTAGMRLSDDRVERHGVQNARRAVQQADLVVLVADASDRLSDHGHNAIDPAAAPVGAVGAAARRIQVLNKVDLAPAAASSCDDRWIATVATEQRGIDRLAQRIVETLVPSPPPAGAAVPVTPRQSAGLERALAASSADEAVQRLRQMLQR